MAMTGGAGGDGSASGGRSHIGSGSTVEGTLQFPGLVELAGSVKGKVTAGSIVVEESARVEGDLTARTVTVKGSVEGRLIADEVRLHASARIAGHIDYGALSIESGAQVNAEVRRSRKA